jgi:hypothetical protein
MFKVRGGIPSKYVEMGLKVFFGFVLVFSMFMAAGGIYNLMEKPLALLPRGGGWTFIYRGNVHIQTLNESIVASIVYVLGISGLYMMFRSTKYAYRPRQAYILLLIGAAITLLSFYYTNVMLQSKIGVG